MAEFADKQALFDVNVSGMRANVLAQQNYDATLQLPGARPVQELSIEDGMLQPDRSMCLVDTEGKAPTDDLETISLEQTHDGMELYLTAAHKDRKPVLKHRPGLLNGMTLLGGKDKTLTHDHHIHLKRKGNTWFEVVPRQLDIATMEYPGLAPRLATNSEVEMRTGNGLVSASQLPAPVTLPGVATITASGFVPRLATDAEVKAKSGNGLVSAGQLAQIETIPRGVIVLWSGAVNAVPVGWALCNGANGTPNLMDRFVVGAGNGYGVGATGGATSHAHGVGIGETTLAEWQIPSHAHRQRAAYENTLVDLHWTKQSTLSPLPDFTFFKGSSPSQQTVKNKSQVINRYYYLPTEPHYSGAAGGNGAHGHSAWSDAQDHRPPYYALAYIMKL